MNVSTPHSPTTARTFAQQLSSTRRGARLARLLAVAEFQAWQVPPSVAERAEQIVAELAANAALHGRVQGRDFRLGLRFDPGAGLLRIAVTDARGDRLPCPTTDFSTPPDAESGRGLLMVTALADRWGTEPYPPSGKTVWAELVTLPARVD
ncbi:ATP-binding protein [Streptomyces sp. MK5]|uniref:ATP-binding protein n=1 Tax=Streptomyces sp. MK5 TaxID=3064253 RepID=UPI002742492E|nr:ATP-binding protein [Streptomyces sp. MK5]